MSIYRTYFQKNNTLIQNNDLNVSQNPVGEISYGTLQSTVSRIIFKVDLSSLVDKLIFESIGLHKIISHKLVLTNTIAQRPDLLGGQSYSQSIERANSFQLDLFEVIENWDEGAGYTFQFNDNGISYLLPTGASNWNYKTTTTPWFVAGAYVSTGATSGITGMTGVTGYSRIIGSQYFEKGNEDIGIDVTDYINEVLFSGTTHHGLGLKMTDSIEKLSSLKRRSVAFHVKNTNTFFEPYIETVFDDNISDDRNFFYMDKDNDLYLYSGQGDIAITGVTIYDFNGDIYQLIPASGITRVKTGTYKITVNVDSEVFPDAVIFKDEWDVVQNGKQKKIILDFYLVNSDSFYTFTMFNRLNTDNYHFSYFGIKSGENVKRGDKRRIQINVKELYKNLDSNNSPLNLEYRLFIKQSNDVEIDVIPSTKVDRTNLGYDFILDTSWLIPQDYYLDLRISDGTVFIDKSSIGFTIVSDDAFTKS